MARHGGLICEGDTVAFALEVGLGEGSVGTLLSALAVEGAHVYLLGIRASGDVQLVNSALARRLKCEAQALEGRPIWPFLTEPDAGMLRQLVSGATGQPTPEFTVLNFVGADQHPFTLRCKLIATSAGALIAGEELVEEHASRFALLEMNNELTVLTRENVRKSRELSAALAELKKTQAMLVHSEKMASLGQMTAGMAHEINNPLAFVSANHETLDRDVRDLLGLTALLDEAIPRLASVDPELSRRLARTAEEIDLAYLADNIPRKIASSREGLERVRQLVLDLRAFSRIDEATWKSCDLEDGIRASLRFLQPLMRAHAVLVETHFAPVGMVWCAPSALNQAVSNVVANAIQASAPDSLVEVTTAVEGDLVLIDVVDHGCGIPEAAIRKVFDPFFTTKPPGSGTGLGLSITHQIIQDHKGRIEITSDEGQGTRVRIRIPVDPGVPVEPIGINRVAVDAGRKGASS
jgi:two-component system NtrC family sensor kinase